MGWDVAVAAVLFPTAAFVADPVFTDDILAAAVVAFGLELFGATISVPLAVVELLVDLPEAAGFKEAVLELVDDVDLPLDFSPGDGAWAKTLLTDTPNESAVALETPAARAINLTAESDVFNSNLMTSARFFSNRFTLVRVNYRSNDCLMWQIDWFDTGFDK